MQNCQIPDLPADRIIITERNMSNDKEFLIISDLKKGFGEGETRQEVLQGINFKAAKGEMCVLLGPSGSGKSTLLNIIGGIDSCDSGTISIGGDTLTAMNEEALTQYRRKHLGYVFQLYNLIPNLNVKENIEVGAFLSDKPLDIDVQDYGKYGDDWYTHYEADIIMHLIKESKRPAYFSPTNPKISILNRDSIYNEGLILKYSPRPYNNFDVAMHNVRDVYHLEYLAEPNLVHDTWYTSEMTDMNHVTLLAHLINRFRKNGEHAQAERLYNILKSCVKRCRIDPDRQEMIEQTLEFWNRK